VIIFTDKKNSRAMVTMAIGEKYQKLFEEFCKPGLMMYCKTFQYDLICISEILDQSERASKRSPAWQKLLILSQPWSANYQQIVWLDTDILINNSNATDIAKLVPIEKVGGVDQVCIPTKELYKIAFQRYYLINFGSVPEINNISPEDYYLNNNILCQQPMSQVFQTGVFVASPNFHKEIFEHTYYNYEEISSSNLMIGQFEMPALSYEIITKNLVFWIQNQFNLDVHANLYSYYPFIFKKSIANPNLLTDEFTQSENLNTFSINLQNSLKTIFDNSIFMHFNGCHHLMPKLI